MRKSLAWVGVRALCVVAGLAAFILLGSLAEGLLRVLPCLAGMARVVRQHAGRNVHLRFDPVLGWSNIPGTFIKDMYGKGADLTINSQGFRAERDFSPRAEAGKVRIACSGDSMTFGYGVGDRQTWCRQLESVDPAVEAVNMGQIMYGLDQFYLWYLRDGAKLHPDIHLVALAANDIARLKFDNIQAVRKPTLDFNEGDMRLSDRPARWGSMVPLMIGLSHQLQGRLELFRWLNPVSYGKGDWGAARGLALSVFGSLAAVHKKDRSLLVAVVLPTVHHFGAPGRTAEMRSFCRDLRGSGIACMDLEEEYDKWSVLTKDQLFLRTNNHYSVDGNILIARLIHVRLLAIPEAAALLSRKKPRPGPPTPFQRASGTLGLRPRPRPR